MASAEPGSAVSDDGKSWAVKAAGKSKTKPKIKVPVIRPPLLDGSPSTWPKVEAVYYGREERSFERHDKPGVVHRHPACYHLTNWLINMSPTKTTFAKPRLGSRGRPEESRAAILKAAIAEFSREGLGGARTDAIARAARVNKALLYYYFKDKDALYGAVLDLVFGGLIDSVYPVLARDLPPREKIIAYAGAHFDYIARHPQYPPIVQGEMMNLRRRRSLHIERIVEQYFRPLMGKIAAVIQQGVDSGDFRPVDPMQFVPTMISAIVFYFINAPVMRLMTGIDPLSSEPMAARRAAVLYFISAALFLRPIPDSQGAQP